MTTDSASGILQLLEGLTCSLVSLLVLAAEKEMIMKCSC